MPKPSTESPVKDVEQAAAFLGVGEDLLYDMVARGEIPHCHVGRYLRFHQADLEEHVRNSHHHQPFMPESLRDLRDRISGSSRLKGRKEVSSDASR